MYRNIALICRQMSFAINPTRRKLLPAASTSFKLSCSQYSTNGDLGWVEELDEQSKKQFKIIQMELTQLLELGREVPELCELTKENYTKLLTMPTNQRHKHYTYLFKMLNATRNDNDRQRLRKLLETENKKAFQEQNDANEHINYGLGRNNMLLRLLERTLMKWKNKKIWRNYMAYRSQMIFDCGFEGDMSEHEIINTAKQLQMSHGINRDSLSPFFLHFCNLNENGFLMKCLQREIPTITKAQFPIGLYTGCFTELFPKQNLVYLTPDSDVYLKEFSHDDIYIIGGFVDKRNSLPLTLAKAKELKIRTARLPLDLFVSWKQSTKSLTLDQMTAIMTNVKLTNDWRVAFRALPRRKIQAHSSLGRLSTKTIA